jgi:hypothetical protein
MLTPDAERAPVVLSTNFYWHLMAAFRSRILCDCVLTLFMRRRAKCARRLQQKWHCRRDGLRRLAKEHGNGERAVQ